MTYKQAEVTKLVKAETQDARIGNNMTLRDIYYRMPRGVTTEQVCVAMRKLYGVILHSPECIETCYFPGILPRA
jgi:hypothetical protein